MLDLDGIAQFLAILCMIIASGWRLLAYVDARFKSVYAKYDNLANIYASKESVDKLSELMSKDIENLKSVVNKVSSDATSRLNHIDSRLDTMMTSIHSIDKAVTVIANSHQHREKEN